MSSARPSIDLAAAPTERRPNWQCLYCEAREAALCGALQDDAGLADLAANRTPIRRVPSGTPVVLQGDPADHVYTVVGGWLAIQEERADGRIQIVKFALPGDVIGLDRNGETYGSTAIALGDARVCSMRRSRHDRLRREHRAYDERFVRQLEQSIQAGYGAIASIALDDARERVARLLWSLAIRSLRRRPQGSADRVWAPLGQTHIALATGLTPVHVSRTLRSLREAGLLELRSHWLIIHDPDEVARLAGCPAEASARADAKAAVCDQFAIAT